MKGRCNRPSEHDAPYYRGVRIDEAWYDFDTFAEWAISNGYRDDLTIDRIDNNKGYCPENCRWITLAEQQRNKSNCRYYTHNGKTQTLSEWAREYHIDRTTLSDRMAKFGFSFEEALTRPINIPRNTKFVTYNGEQTTFGELSKICGISKSALRARVRLRGWSLERAMSEPVRKRKQINGNKKDDK